MYHVVFMQVSCYLQYMANLQVRNIPEDLHERLRRHAKETNSTMSALVLAAVERELGRREWRERWEKMPTTDLGVSAATLLEEARAEREAQLAARDLDLGE